MSERKNQGINYGEDATERGQGPKTRDGKVMMLIKVLVFAMTLTVMFGYLANRSIAQRTDQKTQGFDQRIVENSLRMMEEGKQIFRFDTFGDEIYWTDKLKLHDAIQGSKFGGVGPGVSPKTALAVGLKVDMEALPQSLINQLKQGKVNLDDPATTLALIKLDAVLGVKRNLQPEW